jgi:hypothetical protein
VDKLRDHGRGHRRRGVLDAFGYSNEHVDVTTEREDDSKDDGRRLERGKHRGGGEERRGGNREEAEEVIVGISFKRERTLETRARKAFFKRA